MKRYGFVPAVSEIRYATEAVLGFASVLHLGSFPAGDQLTLFTWIELYLLNDV